MLDSYLFKVMSHKRKVTSFRFLANERTRLFLELGNRGNYRNQPASAKASCSIRNQLIHLVPVSQELASLPFVGTLESDDDVNQLDNECDSDEEPGKVYRHCIYLLCLLCLLCLFLKDSFW